MVTNEKACHLFNTVTTTVKITEKINTNRKCFLPVYRFCAILLATEITIAASVKDANSSTN